MTTAPVASRKWKFLTGPRRNTSQLTTSVKSYLCEHTGLIPTHSERFMPGRIEWKRLRKPSKEAVTKKILELKEGIKWRRQEVKRLEGLI